MKAKILSALGFLADSLKYPFIILIIGVTIAASLFINDRYQALERKKRGDQLIEKIESQSSCKKTANPGEILEALFTFTNNNDSSIGLEKVEIEKSLFNLQDKTFFEFAGLEPNPQVIRETDKYYVYQFDNLTLPANSNLTIKLKIKAADRQLAKAAPHTFVQYNASLFFSLDYEIIFESKCEIQVRYR